MFTPSGSLVVNGITDPEMPEIFEIKAKHDPTIFNFNPQQIQTIPPQILPGGQKTPARYNNVVFTWSEEQGLRVVQDVIALLLKTGEKAKVQGQ
jgi:hypothetical protein